jgi:hypothetical protein
MVWIELDGRLVNLEAFMEVHQVDGETESALYLVPLRGEEPIRAGAGTPDQMAAALADLKGQLAKAGHAVLSVRKVKAKGPHGSAVSVFFGKRD